MNVIKIAAGALNQTALDWDGNLKNIVSAIEMARQQGVSILCLPELCVSGYGCEDAFHSRGVEKTAHEMLQHIVQASRGIVVSVGVPLTYSGGLFNTACLIVDGQIVGFAAKQHLAGDGIHYEPRWFKPWPAGIVGEVKINQQKYPVGDIIFDAGGVRIGFEICEDAWVAARPGARHTARGADIILNPSASHFSFGKHDVRRQFVMEGSRAFHVSYVYVNLLGNESGRAIYDGESMIAIGGELVASGKRFSYEPVVLTTASVNVEKTRMSRARTGSFQPEMDGDESDVFFAEFEYPEYKSETDPIDDDGNDDDKVVKFEEFTQAISLALFDYLRKSRSRGFVVSLSGGVDSTAVVILCSTMIRYATGQLGIERFAEQLRYIFTETPESIEEITSLLLTTLYQGTRNSSETTRHAAQAVANEVASDHLEFDIDQLVEDYKEMVSEKIGRELTWNRDDIALQNIQARVRSPGVWMLANLKDAILLATSNRSEIAVGYATMDGDTSGGLAPIAGIDKAFLRRWLRWIEKDGPANVGNFPSTRFVNAQQPTAELRPAGSGQTDEGDLMPYEILDVIERFAILDKLMPVEVYQQLVDDYPDQDPQQLGQWIIRFFRLFCRNQWKRERFAPSFHVDDESLDPKTWLRFPILSGGFELEIGRLEKLLGEQSS